MEIVEDRYQAGSTIITSQLPVSTWHDVIGEPTVADAILDRLVHNAYRLELDGVELSMFTTLTTFGAPRGITLAELEARSYDRSLATGSLAGASTIGFLIPPSLPMIVYGVLAEVSILKLFIAGIVPGLLLAAGFSLMTMLLVTLRGTSWSVREDACRPGDRRRSLRQLGPVTALVLVLIGAGLLSFTSSYLVSVTEDILAPASYGAIGLIGAYLVLRGARSLWHALASMPATPTEHDHSHKGHHHDDLDCGCGHAHGPTLEQVRDRMSLREMAALVGSIAMRPCTGALFLLVIAWSLGLLPAGILATFAMGLGTASFNLIVAGSGFGAHSLLSVVGTQARISPLVSPVAQLTAGLIVVAASVGMLVLYI